MKTYFLAMACAAAGVFGSALIGAGTAEAGGPIGDACMQGGRAASPDVCGCIQHVADLTLSRQDQRRASDFFRDPDQAQEVRMSDSQSDEDFWHRYKNFATTAEDYCAR